MTGSAPPSILQDESITIKLDQVWETLFLKNITFISMPSSDFPYPLFLDDKEINCGYSIDRLNITASFRTWLNENIEHQLYIISRDHSCYYGLSLFFTHPEDAIKFTMKFGDKIKKFD